MVGGDESCLSLFPAKFVSKKSRPRRDICFGIFQTVASGISGISAQNFGATISFRGAGQYNTAFTNASPFRRWIVPHLGPGETWNAQFSGINSSTINATYVRLALYVASFSNVLEACQSVIACQRLLHRHSQTPAR